MRKKTDIEMERARIAKTMRALIRLRKSLEADKLINEMIPDTMAEFDSAVQGGIIPTLADTFKLLED